MALNFPNNPGIGSVFTDTTSGFSYEWDGTVWKSYSAASTSNIRIIDDISGSFNGIGKTFALTIGGVSFIPANAQSLIITLGGALQEPIVDYTVSTTNIVFDEAPEAALSFSGVSLGPAIPVTTIPDGTITDGDFTVSDDFSVLGFTTTKNLYATGIVTATSGFVGNVTGTATGLSGTPNVTVGVITATEFDITGSTNTLTAGGLNVGVATATTLRVGTAVTISAGVVTATSFVGNLTGTATTATTAEYATTAGIATVSQGLSGTPNLNVGVVTVTTGIATNFTVSGVGTITQLVSTNANITGVATAPNIVASTTLSVGTGATATANVELDVNGSYAGNVVSATTAIDCSTGNYFTSTVNGTVTFTVSNIPSSRSYGFVLQVTHTSGTINWFPNVVWPDNTAPTLTTGRTHMFVFITSNGGSTWRGSSLINYTS